MKSLRKGWVCGSTFHRHCCGNLWRARPIWSAPGCWRQQRQRTGRKSSKPLRALQMKSPGRRHAPAISPGRIGWFHDLNRRGKLTEAVLVGFIKRASIRRNGGYPRIILRSKIGPD